MSFSNDVKKELCKTVLTSSEQAFAESYGILLFARVFSGTEIRLKTESIGVAGRTVNLLTSVFGVIVEKASSLRAVTGSCNLHTLRVTLPDECEKIYSAFGHTQVQPSLRLNRANIDDERCIPAFLRGAFMSCGSVSDPQKNYHLEFCVPHRNLCGDLCTILGELDDCYLTPGIVRRSGAYVVYLKDSEQITDLLTYIGAPCGAMSIMNAKAYKQMRNITNRRTNSELANISRTACASAVQLAAIDRLESAGMLQNLPDKLLEIAALKRSNPELSLSELGRLTNPPISRSGVNHRLQKLIELSDSLPG